MSPKQNNCVVQKRYNIVTDSLRSHNVNGGGTRYQRQDTRLVEMQVGQRGEALACTLFTRIAHVMEVTKWLDTVIRTY